MNRREFLMGAAATTTLLTEGRAATAAGLKPIDKSYAYEDGGKIVFAGIKSAGPLRVWIAGDTHLALHDARDDAHADEYARMAQYGGKPEAFEAMLADAKKTNVDLLVLVGDIISFPTLANVEFVKRALDRSGVDWLYVAGNHDWHFEGDAGSDIAQRKRWTAERLSPLYRGTNPLMASRVVKGVRFVTIDNSVYHVLPEQVDFYRAEAAKGEPVCLCMHIPLWLPGWEQKWMCGGPNWGAAIDPSWQVERRERWSERPIPSTYAFRDAVLATPNLVGVFAGHIHRTQIGRLNGQNFFTAPRNANKAHFDLRIG